MKTATAAVMTSVISTTEFVLGMTCSRAHIMTFLWHANGSKAETAANPFEDVKDGDYYYDSVLWAVEKEITKGTPVGTLMAQMTIAAAARAPLSFIVVGASNY